jgi:hypothetical protein
MVDEVRQADGASAPSKFWAGFSARNLATRLFPARQAAYPNPEGWQAVFDRVHPVQVGFFEALFAL